MFSSFKSVSVAAFLWLSPCILAQVTNTTTSTNGTAATNSATSVTSSTPVYLGCYKDTGRGNALRDFASKTATTVSVASCAAYCATFNAKLYGVGWNNYCFCGNSIGAGTVVAPETECNTACPGNSSDFCGATNRVNMYGPQELLTKSFVLNNSTYQGCYKEPAAGRRAFLEYPILTNTKMTTKMCQDYCVQWQTPYFGVEGGNECHCGSNITAVTLANRTQCTRACGGSTEEFCGTANTFLNIYAVNTAQFIGSGLWGPLITFPNIPVAVALIPETGNMLTWSSGWPNRWTVAGNGKTYTSIYDTKTKQVSQLIVQNTKHDMFCPGISLQEDGRINVNGGSGAAKTSIYNSSTNSWTAGGDMQIPRGYQASTLTSDGNIFTIGGSFSGSGIKDGEIFTPASNTWTKLPKASARPMAIGGGTGYTADSHAWLFAWKNGSVLQAGPSKQMNWYGTRGQGSQKGIGNRAADGDAMCGVNLMFDAVAGKIFTLGGSPSYSGNYATSNAHIITIGEVDGPVNVEKIGNGQYARGFANGVVLPDGTIFIVGGQTYQKMFSDDYPVLFPEIFNPVTRTFKRMRPHPIARNYHSVALLMPDATIFSGGGGLCDGCTANHFNGHFYSPPYLLLEDGKTLAPRPEITSISSDFHSSPDAKATIVQVGGQLSVQMASADQYTFSLIRMSSATHATNTDQRRIPYTPEESGTDFVLDIPADSGIALPGYWMLFGVNSNGVPSIARTVQILRASSS